MGGLAYFAARNARWTSPALFFSRCGPAGTAGGCGQPARAPRFGIRSASLRHCPALATLPEASCPIVPCDIVTAASPGLPCSPS